MGKGMDVSSYQGDLSIGFWNAARVAGYDFVIVRAGFGVSASQIDAQFINNVERAYKAGFHIGAYWFYYGTDDTHALRNANAFLEILERVKGKIDYPVYCDYEYDSDNYIKRMGAITPSRTTRTRWVTQFCEQLEKAGYYAGVYANPDYFNNYFDKSKLIGRFTTWLAYWGDGVEPPKGYQAEVWQYTSRGKIGSVDPVDLNLSYKDFPKIIRGGGFNGFEKTNGGGSSVGGNDSDGFIVCPHCGAEFKPDVR